MKRMILIMHKTALFDTSFPTILYIQFSVQALGVIVGHTADKVCDHDHSQVQTFCVRFPLRLFMVHGLIEIGHSVYCSSLDEGHLFFRIIQQNRRQELIQQ